jgi:hypothetical protein
VDLVAIIFNPVSSAILRWLIFEVVSWGHDFQPCTAMVWDCLIVGLFWLHHIQSLANATFVVYCLCSMVTMATKLFIAINSVKVSLS